MPGNEAGERIHNFFGQENLSQGQHHQQLSDGTWPGQSNNLWVGNQRQIGANIHSNFKNYNIQPPADSERGRGHSSSLPHGLNNFTQLPFQSEFARNQSQNQQLNLNGYMQGHQAFHGRQNETNFLGVDTESDQRNFTSRGPSVIDSHLGNGHDLKQSSVSLESTESPVNYDFFGGQQQMSGQHLGLLQPSPAQQSGISDMQVLQQQVMLKQMQEYQRQQHIERALFQQQETRQLSSMGPLSSVSKHSNQSPALINGIPIHDTSNRTWQSEALAGNMSLLQHGGSSVMQGSPGGIMFSPEQVQTMRLMGMVPQQVDQSHFGVPVSTSKDVTSQHVSQAQMNKPTMQPGTTNGFSFPSHQYSAFPNQVSMQDGGFVARQEYIPSLGNASEKAVRGRQEIAGSSDTSHEKVASPVPPPQTAASLDPTEEKFLFGSDDNLWDAFGGSLNTGSGGLNISDGSDFLGALPSLQNGSWSALMQSAVAETSSGDAGVQDEWSGLNVQNNKTLPRNQMPFSGNDANKQQSAWVDKNFQAASVPNSRPYLPNDAAKKGVESCSVSDVQKSTPGPFLEQGQTNSSEGFVQKLPNEASRWLDRSSLLKPADSKFVQNASNPTDAGSWAHWQSKPSYNSDSQRPSIPNGRNFIESMSPAREATSQHFQNNHKSTTQEAMTGAKPGMQRPPVEDFSFNVGKTTKTPSARVTQKGVQPHPSSPNLNFWSNVNSVDPRDSGVPGNHLDKGTIESLGNNDLDKEEVKMHEFNFRENSSESSHPISSHHNRREIVHFDASDSHNLPGGNQKSTGQLSRKSPVARKFQYHPMGDLDVETPSGTKQATNAQYISQQASLDLKGRDQEYHGQSRYAGRFMKNAIETDEAHLAGFQGDPKGPDVPSKSFRPVSVPGTSAPLDGPADRYASNKDFQSGQNMLELLHKVDQPSSATHVNSDPNQSSEIPEMENSDGSASHLQQNQSSASRGFGLQLGQPSQRLSTPHGALILSSSEAISSRAPHAGSKVGGEQENSQSLGRSTLQPRKLDGNRDIFQASKSAIASVPDFSSGVASSKGVPNSSINTHNQALDSAPPFPVLEATPASQLSYTPGVAHQAAFPQMLPNAWTNIAAKQHSSGTRGSVPPSNSFMTHLQSNNSKGTCFPVTQKLDDQISQVGHISACSPNMHGSAGNEHPKNERQESPCQDAVGVGHSQRKESVKKHLVDPSPSQISATQKDIEAFGRTLRPNNLTTQNYGLPHQVLPMPNIESDPCGGSVNRFKNKDSGLEDRHIASHGGSPFPYGSDFMNRNLATNSTTSSSFDSRTMHFSSKPGLNLDVKESSHEMLAGSHNDSQNNSSDSNTTGRGERSHISPQMAPCWFDQYGTFKNEIIVPAHDARKIASQKTMEQPLLIRKPFDSLHPCNSAENAAPSGLLSDTRHSIPATIANEMKTDTRDIPATIAIEPVSSQLLQPDTSDQSLILRPRKRKIASLEPLPWHREVTHGSLRFQTISCGVAQMANLRLEQIDNETGVFEDSPPAFKSKRRLILATQLMQQLFRPPPSSVLSANANAQYESVVYFVGRSVLGDASRGLSHHGNDTVPETETCMKRRGSVRTDQQSILLKAAEILVARLDKLETDFLRMEKRSSMLDVRLECQDLEKFSVINRFAKFHGRGQVDSAETSSSSSDQTQKFYPLRYVTALPMPRTLPDNVQCLSL
ncbi:uncharacterized protein [Rutidosis leptorrhynchoides]|uniref:uncharacterized protein n=1 Tax=Rutidosis leptorrhynchoides TaxID=125765 RepID=UPI003A9A6009